MTLFRNIDFETTGFNTELERHAICEVGFTDVIVKDAAKPLVLEPVAELCNPGRAMPIEALSVHHIRDCELVGKPSPDRLFMKLMSGGADYFVAHNIDHEKQFFAGGETPWICTYKSALRVWPAAPGHSLSVLRYFLHIDEDPDFERELAFPVHRGGPDSYVGAFIFTRLLEQASVEQMTRWSSGPALLSVCYMKAHKGKLWSEVPADYLDWILHKSDITDRDLRATAKFYWKQKTEKKAQPEDQPREERPNG